MPERLPGQLLGQRQLTRQLPCRSGQGRLRAKALGPSGRAPRRLLGAALAGWHAGEGHLEDLGEALLQQMGLLAVGRGGVGMLLEAVWPWAGPALTRASRSQLCTGAHACP